MASKSGKEVTVKVENNNGHGRGKSRSRSRSRARGKAVKITVDSKSRSGGGRRGRSKRQSNKRVRNIVKQQLDKSGVTGPKPAIRQRATATLGTIGSNSSGKTELEACILTNPILVKDNTGNNTFGPIVALGAQYSLWRIRYLQLKFTPMVGQSAVTGTVVRASLNPTATPSSTGWSGLGARKHMDIVVGKSAIFNLKASDLSGPREGWWLTNTNDSGDSTLGPSIEIHTLGLTKSAYQNQDFSGGLFLCEMRAEWEFSGYSANPNLLSLEKNKEDNVHVEFEGQQGDPLTMVVDGGSLFYSVTSARSTFVRGITRNGQSRSDTIWQIVDTAVSAAETLVPPPFSWLVKGGYWFVKKVAGRAQLRTGAAAGRYVCYASYQDALSDRPAICTGTAPGAVMGRTSPARVNLQFSQMNEPSTGLGPTPTALRRYVPDPSDLIHLRCKVETVGTSNMRLIKQYSTHTLRVKSGSNASFIHAIVRVAEPRFYSPEWEQMVHPGPMGDVKLYGGDTFVGDVLSVHQYHGLRSKTFTAFLVSMNRDLTPRVNSAIQLTKTGDENTLVASHELTGGAHVYDCRLGRHVWYLMMSFGDALGNWRWTPEGMTTNYVIPNNILMPCLFQISPDFVLTLPFRRILAPIGPQETLAEDGDPDEDEQEDLVQSFELSRNNAAWAGEGDWCDTYDAAEPPPSEVDVGDEETDTETQSEEDETDEVDRFDLHDSSGSEPEDDDVENSRVTLLNTLVNQGMDVLRAAKISKRAYPTHSEKIRRSVYMDYLAMGCSPASAWSEACKAARRATRSKEPVISGSRGHAE